MSIDSPGSKVATPEEKIAQDILEKDMHRKYWGVKVRDDIAERIANYSRKMFDEKWVKAEEDRLNRMEAGKTGEIYNLRTELTILTDKYYLLEQDNKRLAIMCDGISDF